MLTILQIRISVIALLSVGIATGYYLARHSSGSIPRQPSSATIAHHAFPVSRDFFDTVLRRTPAQPLFQQEPISGVIINHHLLAPHLIANTLARARGQRVNTIILLSPNHYSSGTAGAITSDLDWETPYGRLRADHKIIQGLARQGVVGIEEAPFKDEHGIFNVLPFIKRLFPTASIVPIMVKDILRPDEADRLAVAIKPYLNAGTITAASLDFSHELTASAAEFHDVKSIDAIVQGDVDEASSLDVDSRPALRILLNLMNGISAHFDPLFHSNAAIIANNLELSDTTSYITGAFVRSKKPHRQRATALMLPPLLCREGITFNSKEIYAPIRRLLQGQDVTLAPGTSDPACEPNNEYLRLIGVNVIDGLSEQSQTTMLRKGNMSIGMMVFQEAQLSDLSRVQRELEELQRTSDRVLVYLAWKDYGERRALLEQRELARTLIDSGADVVLGTGSGETPSVEVYTDGVVFPSLGTLDTHETSIHALALGIVFDKWQTRFVILPIGVSDGLVALLDAEQRSTILEELARQAIMPASEKEELKHGILTYAIKKKGR